MALGASARCPGLLAPPGRCQSHFTDGETEAHGTRFASWTQEALGGEEGTGRAQCPHSLEQHQCQEGGGWLGAQTGSLRCKAAGHWD